MYSDEVPISLETLGFEPKGAYRTTKKEERHSPFAEYIHVYDQSFGGEEIGLEYLSYSLFSSPYSFVRNIVETEMFGEAAIEDGALARNIGVERSITTGKILIKGKDSILTVSSTKNIDEEDLFSLSALLK